MDLLAVSVGTTPEEVSTDFSRWPLVVTRVPEEISPAALRDYLAWWDREVLGRRQDFVMILDARAVQRFSALCRKEVIDSMGGHRDGQHCGGCALVLASEYAAALSDVIVEAANPSHPVRVFDDVGDACTWARGLVA